MKISQPESENERNQEFQELNDKIEALETMLEEIRHIIGHRRTMLTNAGKKLQEFQDMMYAMIMEEEYPKKKYTLFQDEDDELKSFWFLISSG